MSTARAIVITGAAGFLGEALCHAFAAAGWDVRAGVRDPAAVRRVDGVRAFRCELPDAVDERALDGASVVIHAAFTTRFRDAAQARRTNVAGTAEVLRASRRAGVGRFVFISSCSAHDGARSLYGRTKLYLEERLDPARDLIVRPGLIVGNGGLFARMIDAAARAPIVPLFDGGRQPVQTVALADAVTGIHHLVEADATGRVVLAEPEPTTMRELMTAIATAAGRSPRFLPVPLGPALAATRAAERLGVPLPLTSENLLGLRALAFQPSREDLQRWGLLVRPFSVTVPRAVRTRLRLST